VWQCLVRNEIKDLCDLITASAAAVLSTTRRTSTNQERANDSINKSPSLNFILLPPPLSLSTLFFQCLVCFTLQFGSFKIFFYYSYLTWLEVRTVGCSSKGVVRLSLSLSLSLWSGCFERLDPLYANTAFESDPPLQLFLCSPSLYCFAQKEQHHLPPHLFLVGFLIHGILTPCIFFYIFFPKLCFSRFVILLFLFLNIIYVAMCFLNYL